VFEILFLGNMCVPRSFGDRIEFLLFSAMKVMMIFLFKKKKKNINLISLEIEIILLCPTVRIYNLINSKDQSKHWGNLKLKLHLHTLVLGLEN
jgi:hypothetical protein